MSYLWRRWWLSLPPPSLSGDSLSLSSLSQAEMNKKDLYWGHTGVRDPGPHQYKAKSKVHWFAPPHPHHRALTQFLA